MESSTALTSPLITCNFIGFGSKSDHRPNFLPVNAKCDLSSRSLSRYCSTAISKQGRRPALISSKRNSRIRASFSSSPSSSSESSSVAPLHFESPVGQFLSEILVNHPHLLPAAVDQQLQQLQIDREAEEKQEETTSTGTELTLYKRIAEVKANERRRVLEEILYALVVQKFVESDFSLVPSLSALPDPLTTVDVLPSGEDDKLQKLHSSEALEMIKNHLSLILGPRLDDGSSIVPMNKLRVGQLYAASIMFGYFLKRVDRRFQLETSMKTLLEGTEHSIPDSSPSPSASSDGSADTIEPCRLRTYVMSFDAETLQRCSSMRSKEAMTIIEKHTEALFGKPEIVVTRDDDIDRSEEEVFKMSFRGLKRLILEAVTFGSFLWDVESYVDSRYHFCA